MSARPSCSRPRLLAFRLRPPAADDPKELAAKAQAVLKTHCYRCHGQDGSDRGRR